MAAPHQIHSDVTAETSASRRSLPRYSAVLALIWLVAGMATSCLGGAAPSGQVQGASGENPTTTSTRTDEIPGSTQGSSSGSDSTIHTDPTTPQPPTTVAAPTTPPAQTFDVIEVTDGDTIKLAGGTKVRLIGIDTPERGQCGYTEAALVLTALIKGQPVTLVAGARDDADRYGRLLRYVEVNGVDLNLEMIRSGRAIARYDSRDGYGRHTRQDVYIRTDDATPSTNYCAPAPAPTAAPAPAPVPVPAPTPAAPTPTAPLAAVPSAPTGTTDPRFGTCKEAKANGYGPYVQGFNPEYDWYRDADRDGTVCE